MSMPNAKRVAQRTIILYMLTMRHSAEICINHPQSEKCVKILQNWINELGVQEEIEPWDLEILRKPLGHLDREQLTDALWCGEAVGVLAWALGLFPALEDFTPVNPNEMFIYLGFTSDSDEEEIASELINTTVLLPKEKFFDYFLKVKTIQMCIRKRQCIKDPKVA